MTSTDLTPAGQQHVTKPQKQPREQRISKPVRRACELLGSGQCKTIKAAAIRVGLSREHLSKMLQRPHVQAFIARKAAANISLGGFKATYRLVELIDADSEHVAAKVSERLAENAGYLKSQAGGGVNVNINNNIAAGYVIDLSTPQPMRSVQPSVTDEA